MENHRRPLIAIVTRMPFSWRAHLPLANRKSNTYNMTLEWSWPWCNLNLIHGLDLREVKLAFSMRWPWSSPSNLDTWTWCCQDVPPHQKWSLYVDCFKSCSLNRHNTHTHTRPTHTHTHYENITSTAYAGRINFNLNASFSHSQVLQEVPQFDLVPQL